MKNNRLRFVYYGMKERCYKPYHPSYKSYSSKGITVCEEWLNSYEAFEKWALENGYDYSKPRGEQELDRIDNTKGYSPDNCRFVNHFENCKNTSRNVWLEHNGKRMILSDWSRELGIPIETIRMRRRKGWDVKDILSVEHFKSGKRHKEVFK